MQRISRRILSCIEPTLLSTGQIISEGWFCIACMVGFPTARSSLPLDLGARWVMLLFIWEAGSAKKLIPWLLLTRLTWVCLIMVVHGISPNCSAQRKKKTNKYRTHSQTIYIVGAFWTNPACHSSGVSVVGSGGSLSPEHLAQSLGPGSGASSHGFVMVWKHPMVPQAILLTFFHDDVPIT